MMNEFLERKLFLPIFSLGPCAGQQHSERDDVGGQYSKTASQDRYRLLKESTRL